MKSNYKRLGDYIQELKVRNTEEKAEQLLGINIDKFFMPSVANVVGTDLSVYKLVRKNQFACNRMHVGRDYRLPVSMSNSDEEFMVSPAYDVFEIKDTKVLNPEFLMMWFTRSEFDRNAWFYTDADVRGGLPWKSFCDMILPIPHPDKQREIVKEYKVLQNRIALNQKLIQKLEETAQAIYKQWFVEFEFPNEEGKPYKSSGGVMEMNLELEKEIPVGWKIVSLNEYCNRISAGGTPSRYENDFWNKKEIPWVKNGEIKSNIICDAEEYISKEGLANSSAKLIPKNSVLLAMYCVSEIQVAFTAIDCTTNQACCALISESELKSSYLFHALKYSGSSLMSSANGSAQINLSKEIIQDFKILFPHSELIKNDYFLLNLKAKEKFTKENILLEQMKNLLLSKLATIEN